jgi:hypothetical protein
MRLHKYAPSPPRSGGEGWGEGAVPNPNHPLTLTLSPTFVGARE